MSLDRAQLREVFGMFATGVTVVTVGGDRPHGMTANSFTPVSLDPPLVLVCVDRVAVMHRRLDDSPYFGVSVLAAGQEPLARHFADRTRVLGHAEFDSVDWHPGRLTEVPLISGALAHFECEIWHCYDGGDHTIVTARLLSMGRGVAGGALLFFGRRFRRLMVEPTEVSV